MDWDLLIDRRDFARALLVDARPAPLAAGQIRLAIERLALSANNLTYAVSGDTRGFWSLFDAPAGFGRIPAWGHAVVEASRHPDVAEGERFFGLLPMSSHWTFTGRRSRLGLRDVSKARAGLNPVYNQYATVRETDPGRLETYILFRPLFITSFVLDHYLASNGYFGASTVWLTSASSRTALGLASLLTSTLAVVGLTSARHLGFVEACGCHRRVIPYPAQRVEATGASLVDTGLGDDGKAATAPAATTAAPIGTAAESDTGPTVVVDFSGDAALVARLAQGLGARLQRVVSVGATHWSAAGTAGATGAPRATGADGSAGSAGSADAPAPAGSRSIDESFFGPDHIEALIGRWGGPVFEARLGEALERFVERSRPWYEIDHADGPQALLGAYRTLAAGRLAPHSLMVARPGKGFRA